VGPRQAGKTTLARNLGGSYFDLEQEGARTRLDVQWDALVTGNEWVILDEAQSHPPVFARLWGRLTTCAATTARRGSCPATISGRVNRKK
jgi:hypothetical protein